MEVLASEDAKVPVYVLKKIGAKLWAEVFGWKNMAPVPWK